MQEPLPDGRERAGMSAIHVAAKIKRARLRGPSVALPSMLCRRRPEILSCDDQSSSWSRSRS